MSRANVELDFFGMEKENSTKSQFQKFLHRRRSFRGLQGAISKMNPEFIKSVISSGLKNSLSQDNVNQIDSDKFYSVLSSPKETQALFPALPASRVASENGPGTTPLTIFYDGTVSIFNVPHHKAESILKLAVEGNSKTVASIETLDGDLPIARSKSLQRFLEKRKESLMKVSNWNLRAHRDIDNDRSKRPNR